MVSSLLVAVSAAALLATASAAKCESPKASSVSYSTTDGFFHFQTAIVTEFTLACANSPKNLQLYAVFNGKVYTVAAAEETNKYQVSILLEHADAHAQTVSINLYDEDGYTAYRKDETTKPLTTFAYNHPGLARKWPVSSETVAVVLSLVAVYYAFYFKSTLN